MAFGQDTIEQLYRELAGGRHLSAKLQALLEGPLDSRGQKEAVDVSRELGRVFMVSLYMLKPCSNSSRRPGEVTRTAPETRTDDSICLHTPARVKRVRSEEVLVKNGREEVVTRTEIITPSPYKDGYQWRKYGQKNIQDSNYLRLYFKCTFSHERRCAAKKQVQQRDAGEPPMFLVTYLNEHTCQQPQAVLGTPNTAGSSPTTSRQRQSSFSPPAEVLDLTMNGAGLFSRLLLPHAVGGGGRGRGSAEEEAAIVTCLAAVISGGAAAAAPPPLIWPTSAPEASQPSGVDVPAFVASAGHSPSAADESVADEAAAAKMADMDYCFGQYDPSTFGAAAADHRVLIGDDGDVQRVVAARIADMVWPRYTRDTSAWETAGTSSMRGSID
uniref:WRKY domain-containing protein n=1 Tax=Oryza meridionalis TaxID=40149 RepID=A0A0E0C9J6_9ORYZ